MELQDDECAQLRLRDIGLRDGAVRQRQYWMAVALIHI